MPAASDHVNSVAPVTDILKAFHFTDLKLKKATRPEDPYEYNAGFGNRFESEVIPGTLPMGQQHPQRPRFGLYMETFTYSAFATARVANLGNSLYRVKPAVDNHGPIDLSTKSNIENCFLSLNPRVKELPTHAQWNAFPIPPKSEKTDFVDGLHTLGGSGDPNLKEGVALYLYAINDEMKKRSFCNNDGDLLIVPQQGILDVQTEYGRIYVQPGEIVVVQRGVRFSVRFGGKTKEIRQARGYITELWGSRFELPDLGPLGSHGLANARDFLTPVAYIDEDLKGDWTIVNKYNGNLHGIAQDHSPYDIVAWHGNVIPYKYDLHKFIAQGSLSVDHTDPSIHTVLTAKSRDPYTPLAEFLTFPPKWDVAENTYRPPSFHRNAASEWLCTLYGEEDASWVPDGEYGAIEFDNLLTPHGAVHVPIDKVMVEHKAEPTKILTNQMTVVVETSRTILWTEYARVQNDKLLTSGYSREILDKYTDNFSVDPEARRLLKQIKEDKKTQKEMMDVYYK